MTNPKNQHHALNDLVNALWSPYEALVAYTRNNQPNFDLLRKPYDEARKQYSQTEQVLRDTVQKGTDLAFGKYESLKKITENYSDLVFRSARLGVEQLDRAERALDEQTNNAKKIAGDVASFFWGMHDQVTDHLKERQRAFIRLANVNLTHQQEPTA